MFLTLSLVREFPEKISSGDVLPENSEALQQVAGLTKVGASRMGDNYPIAQISLVDEPCVLSESLARAGEMSMRPFVIWAAGVSLAACTQSIKIPYFEPIPVSLVCGGFSSKCQPAVSRNWEPTTSLDYSGVPSSFLGRSYTDIFSRSVCGSQPTGAADVSIFGSGQINGRAISSAKSGLSEKLGGDISKFVSDTFTTLPANLKSTLAANVSASVLNSLDQSVELRYERVQLSDDFIDNRLIQCLSTVDTETRVITGISTINVKGSWISRRISDATAALEASAEYNALTATAKADYVNARDRALNGTYEPMRLVFAVAYVPGTASTRSARAN